MKFVLIALVVIVAVVSAARRKSYWSSINRYMIRSIDIPCLADAADLSKARTSVDKNFQGKEKDVANEYIDCLEKTVNT